MSAQPRYESALNEHGLPASVFVEKLVLGSVQANGRLFDLTRALAPEDFSIEKHRLIYAAMTALHERGGRIDRITVMLELQARRQLEAVDGLSYLTGLDDGLPPIFQLQDYVEKLREFGRRRRLITACHRAAEETILGAGSGDAAARINRELEEIGKTNDAARMQSVGEIIESVGVEKFCNPASGRLRSVLFPWPGLQRFLGGMEAGQMITVAARPGVGKSVLSGQIADHNAALGNVVALFSLEMPSHDILRRIVCARAGVQLFKQRSGFLNEFERMEFTRVLADMQEANYGLSIRDSVEGVQDVEAAIACMKTKPALVVVDYLQLMAGGRSRNSRYEEVSDVSRQLKLMALKMGVPFVVLAQLNRESEKDGREPRLSDLAMSGGIEQDSDVVMLMHRKKIEGEQPAFVDVDLIIAKHRNGPEGRVTLQFNRRCVRFDDRAGGDGT